MFSALPLRADIAQCSRHVRLVPKPEVGGQPFDHLVGAGEFVPAAFAMCQRRRDSLTRVDKDMVEATDGKSQARELIWSLKRVLLRPVSRPGTPFINPLNEGMRVAGVLEG